MAVTVLAASAAAKASKSTQFQLVKGAVGEGAATEFLNFAKHANLADPEALLANPCDFVPSVMSDQLLELIRSLELCLRQELDAKRWDAAWEIAHALHEAHMEDLSALFAQSLVRLGATSFEPPAWIKVFASTLEQLTTE